VVLLNFERYAAYQQQEDFELFGEDGVRNYLTTETMLDDVLATSRNTRPPFFGEALRTLDGYRVGWIPKGELKLPELSTASITQENIGSLHAALIAEIEALEEILPVSEGKLPGLGHNFPPEELQSEIPGLLDVQDIEQALNALKSGPPVPDKVPEDAQKAVEALQTKRAKIVAWLALQGDNFASAAVTAAGKEFGKWAPRVFWLVVTDKLLGISQAALAWFAALKTLG
jgi:hypothetical protein